MKKIYLSLMAGCLALAGNAQKMELTPTGNCELAPNFKSQNTAVSANKVATAAVNDSNYYFFNKHFFRNAPPTNNSFPTFKNAPTYTASNFPQRWGAVFLNSGSLEVTGAEVLTFAQQNSASSNVDMQIELYNVVSGVPSGAAINSMTVSVPTGTAGSFYGGAFASPSTVSGDYAIIFKNVSPVPQDTIRVFFTNAQTATSTAAPNERFGEGLGIVGTQASFFTMTGLFTPTVSSDYEPIVVPHINYTVTTDHNFTTTTICNTDMITYVNATSPWVNHRMYNMNRFFKYWAPFGNTTAYNNLVTANAIDSVFTWDFGDGAPFEYAVSPTRAYSTITSSLAASASLASRIRKQGTLMFVMDTKTWNVDVTICNVGLTENNIENQFTVYPNPAANSAVVYLNNANENSQISVLNALGQVVMTQKANMYKNELNLGNISRGVYFVRVSDGKQSSTTKLVIDK